ncbi:MAG: hypothetical protein AAGJ82_14850 [Bacteroidota bacterium]
MTSAQRAHLEALIANGYPHSSSECLALGWQIYRSRLRDFMWFALLQPLIASVFTVVGLSNIGLLLMTFLVSPILNAGFYLGAERATTPGAEWSFSVFFAARAKAVPLLFCTLASSLLLAVMLIPTYLLFERAGILEWYQEVVANPAVQIAPPELNATQSNGFFLNLLPVIYLQVGFSWAVPLILFWNTHPIKALEWSRRLVTRRFWPQFILLLTFFSLLILISIFLAPLAGISSGLANLGTFLLFLVFPWAYCSLYAGFRRTTMVEAE